MTGYLRRWAELAMAVGALAALLAVWRQRAGRGRAPVLPTVAAAALVPWTVGVAVGVPDQALARHWNTAWTGLDVAITVGLAVTAWLARRRDRRTGPVAAATAALMCADAWFDVCTSASAYPAMAEAVLELAVAAGCLLLVRGRDVHDSGLAITRSRRTPSGIRSPGSPVS